MIIYLLASSIGFMWILFIWLLIVVAEIFLWRAGTKRKNVVQTILGAFMCLKFLGVIIAVVQIFRWKNQEHEHYSNYFY